MLGRWRSTMCMLALVGAASQVPALGAVVRARPRVCVVTVALPGEQPEAVAVNLRQALEQGLARERRVELVPHVRYADLARARGLEPAQWSTAEHLAELGAALDLHAALLLVVAPHGEGHRLLVAAVDPLDGAQMATASTVLPTLRLDRKRARALSTALVRELVAWLAAEQATPPPPPPPAAP